MTDHHSHTFLQWLNHNWAVISLVWFPAFLGYLNAAVASLKVMGFDRAAQFLGKLEDGIKTFVDTLKNQGGSNAKTNTDPGITGSTTTVNPGASNNK